MADQNTELLNLVRELLDEVRCLRQDAKNRADRGCSVSGVRVMSVELQPVEPVNGALAGFAVVPAGGASADEAPGDRYLSSCAAHIGRLLSSPGELVMTVTEEGPKS